MRTFIRILIAGIGALLTLGTLSGCSGTESPSASSSTGSSAASSTPAPAPEANTPFPESAKYIADMAAAEGRTMTIGIAVDGADIAAYACNGVDDEAWFFGTQTDGQIDITGKFRDTLSASFDGTDVVGDLTMNGVSYRFSAAAVAAPAGMYTGEVNGIRATWVVRPGDTAVGVQHDTTLKPIDASPDPNLLTDPEFRDQIRNGRSLRPASPILSLQDGSGIADIDGQQVTLQIVNGDFRL